MVAIARKELAIIVSQGAWVQRRRAERRECSALLFGAARFPSIHAREDGTRPRNVVEARCLRPRIECLQLVEAGGSAGAVHLLASISEAADSEALDNLRALQLVSHGPLNMLIRNVMKVVELFGRILLLTRRILVTFLLLTKLHTIAVIGFEDSLMHGAATTDARLEEVLVVYLDDAIVLDGTFIWLGRLLLDFTRLIGRIILPLIVLQELLAQSINLERGLFGHCLTILLGHGDSMLPL